LRGYFKYLAVGVSYYLIILLISLAYFLINNSDSLSDNVFLYFDAVHYYNVAIEGYLSHYEVAFFPLFPFAWNFLGLSLIGISCLNAVIYISCIAFLGKAENMNWADYLIALALPSAVFYFIPYSEAFYFISCGLLLYGIRENKFHLEILGIILCCFCRPVLPVIFPAVLLFSLYEKSTMYKAVIRSATALAGTLSAFFIHWIYTGNFFSYFSAFNTWDYNFRFPLLPLKSGGGNMITHIDGYALLFGIISILLVIIFLKNNNKKNEIKSYEFFSLVYLSFFTLLILGLLRGGSLTSLNRFIFCSPFFIVSLFYIEKNFIKIKSTRNILLLLMSLVLFGLLFQSYVHIQVFIKYLIVAILFSFYLAKKHSVLRIINVEKTILLLMLIALQLVCVNKFLNGQWVG